MKKVYILLLVFLSFLFSCTKQNPNSNLQCMQNPPIWCATVRCNPDGKAVCGCNNVTYGSACEAQCAGVVTFTAGACR